MNRRKLLHSLGAMGLGTHFANEGMATQFGNLPTLEEQKNIFRSIGVEPIINCRGTFTIIGGSIELQAVREAMEAAAHNFIQYDELAEGIGKRLATLTGAEWGMVSAGCAAGLKHITAACVTGGDPEKLIRIPDLSGFEKTEVIVPVQSRNAYDHSIRNIGVKIIDVSNMEELENAISSRTAMIYMLADDPGDIDNPLPLEKIVNVARPKQIPVLVDCAAEVLTIPNLHLKRGATIVAYSGGKAICGPQCAGLMLGDKSILSSAWQASSPHHGPGRDNKVGREEMIGMLAAVEAWTKRDHEKEWKRWLGFLDHIKNKLAPISSLKMTIFEPTQLSNKSPVLSISWNPDVMNLTGEELAEELGRTPPRIAIGSFFKDNSSGIQITTGQMQDGEERIVADRLFDALTRKRSKAKELTTPADNLTGEWEVTMDFLSSRVSHRFQLSQNENWLSGNYHGTFHRMKAEGYVDGDQFRLKCTWRMPGNQLEYIFIGVIDQVKISGNVHLGEYRTASFSASRLKRTYPNRKFNVPGGPPLAT